MSIITTNYYFDSTENWQFNFNANGRIFTLQFIKIRYTNEEVRPNWCVNLLDNVGTILIAGATLSSFGNCWVNYAPPFNMSLVMSEGFDYLTLSYESEV